MQRLTRFEALRSSQPDRLASLPELLDVALPSHECASLTPVSSASKVRDRRARHRQRRPCNRPRESGARLIYGKPVRPPTLTPGHQLGLGSGHLCSPTVLRTCMLGLDPLVAHPSTVHACAVPTTVILPAFDSDCLSRPPIAATLHISLKIVLIVTTPSDRPALSHNPAPGLPPEQVRLVACAYRDHTGCKPVGANG